MRRELTAFLILPIMAASCSTQDGVGAIWSNPAAYHDHVVEVVVHPYDLLSDPGRYILCFQPCSQAQAVGVQSVLMPLEDGRWDGFRGDQAVRLKLRFDGRCFTDGAVCLLDHRPYVFIEEP